MAKKYYEDNDFIEYDEDKYEECFYCGGDGKVDCDCCGGGGVTFADEDCIACCGTGFHTCPECKGTGICEIC